MQLIHARLTDTPYVPLRDVRAHVVEVDLDETPEAVALLGLHGGDWQTLWRVQTLRSPWAADDVPERCRGDARALTLSGIEAVQQLKRHILLAPQDA
jgi:hypothetical protein